MMARTRNVLALGLATLAAGMFGFGPDDAHTHKAEVGKAAPDFMLVDVKGKEHKLSEYTKAGNVVVLEWFNPRCPYVVKHYREDTNTTLNLEKKYAEEKVVWLRINSGHAESGTSGKELNAEMAEKWAIKSPILLDLDGKVGKMYKATNTPAMYVINAEGELAYHGALDDNRSPRAVGERNYVDEVVGAVLAGETIATSKTKPYGCSVKYKK